MSRRFFVLFFMYFFVVQSLIFGAVWGEPNFYIIGLINFVFIVLMYFFYKNFDLNEEKTSDAVHAYQKTLGSRHRNKKPFLGYVFVLSICLFLVVVFAKVFFGALSVSIWRFAGFYFIMLFLSAKKLLDKKIYLGSSLFLPKDFLFLTSLIVVMGVYGTLDLELFVLKVLLATLIGFVFFFVGAGIVKESGAIKVFRLFFTKLYIGVLAVLILVLGVNAVVYDGENKFSSDLHSLSRLASNWFSADEVLDENETLTGDIVLNTSGELLVTSLSGSLLTGGEEIIDVVDPEEVVKTGEVISFDDMEPEQEDDKLDVPVLPTLMDVVIYLMDHYSIPLSPEKNITFTYVTPKNTYYPQFRTAYDNLLIGKTANPSKNVLCQTYIVMKGLLEDWDVGSYTDIKSTYRKEAQEKGVLNGCKWNFYVKNINL